MKHQDLIKFTAMLVGIGELYGKDISELLTDLYWQALKCFELQNVNLAFDAHIHNPDGGQYFPKPADIVKLIDGTSETKALQAWAKVSKAIMQIGAYQTVVFDDPLIHAVLADLGGWIKLCATSIEDLPFRANEFQKRYMMFVNKPPVSYPKCCYGITGSVNAVNGYAADRKLLVGDLKKAAQVMNNGDDVSLLINVEDLNG